MRSEDRLPKISEDEAAIHEVVSQYYDAFVKDPVIAASYYGEPTLVVLQRSARERPLQRNPGQFDD